MNDAAPIAVFGDWHGDWQFARLAIQSAKRENITHLIHVGDASLDWPERGRGRPEDRLNRVLVANDQFLYISPGNHDCLVRVDKRPVDDEGWITWRSNIKVLPKGGRSVIGGLVVGHLGGAYSVDGPDFRTIGKDWWPDEEPTMEQAERLIAGGPVDLLVTHDAPTGVDVVQKFDLPAEIKERADRTRHLLAKVVREIQPGQLVCGHWHQRVTSLIHHPGGNTTRVDVLGMEHREGNGIVLRRGESGLQVEPLLIRGKRPGE